MRYLFPVIPRCCISCPLARPVLALNGLNCELRVNPTTQVLVALAQQPDSPVVCRRVGVPIDNHCNLL